MRTRAERRRTTRLKMRKFRRLLKAQGYYKCHHGFTEKEMREDAEKEIRRILSGRMGWINDWDYWNDPARRKARAKVDFKEQLDTLNDVPEPPDEDFDFEDFDFEHFDDFEIEHEYPCSCPICYDPEDYHPEDYHPEDLYYDYPEPYFEYGGIKYPGSKPKELQ